MVESRENYKFDLGVKGFIKVVKEQVMKLMAIIKQEMQLLRGWQAGKRCGDICITTLYQSVILTWFLSHEAIGNIATSHDPSPPLPSAFHKISLTVNWYPFLLLVEERLCKSLRVMFHLQEHNTMA